MLTVPTVPLVLCTALIALTLLISGIAKAKDPQSTVTGIENLGLQKIAPARAVSLILPWFEIALAAVLLLSPVRLPAVIASGLALVLMIFYTVVIARALATGRTAGCNCFGSGSTAPVSRYTLFRNLSLLVAAAGTHAAALGRAAQVCSSRCSHWMPPAGSGRAGPPSSRQPWMRYAAATPWVRRMSVRRLSCPSRCTTRTARSCTCACPPAGRPLS